MHGTRDLFIIPYSTKWAYRFQSGPSLKLCNTQEEAIELAWYKAKQFESEVYVQDKNGKFKKAKKPA